MITSTLPLAGAVVSEHMHTGVVTCTADATLYEVAAAMAGARIHCVLVAGVGHRGAGEHLVWGVLSDLDLVGALRDAPYSRAAELAATDPVTIAAGAPLLEAAQRMAENEVAHLVVLDELAEPAGVISTLDIARAAASAG